MSNNFEVDSPILCSPYYEPTEHWWITEGEPAQRRTGRRPALYHYREPGHDTKQGGWTIELKLVNRIRERVKSWREQGWPGVTRTTHDLLTHWQNPERQHRLFFAQREAAETIIFLTEARADFLQGIDVPRDEPGEESKARGYQGFLRYACKMATGSGKTTVMGMLAAWSILNKVAAPSDKRFSDVVLIVCPNVTIRDRLRELDTLLEEASLYRTRDLVPAHQMPLLARGQVLVTNWHVFEPRTPQTAGDGGKVTRVGVAVTTTELITISDKTTTARGIRYLTREDFERQVNLGLVEVDKVLESRQGQPMRVRVRTTRYLESDTALVRRLLGNGKGNILVFNDEAHHAYRLQSEEPDPSEEEDDEETETFYKEATIWVEGLDRIHKLRGINFCVDLSATPYYLGRVGKLANRPFPWVVSEFGLIDAIESGLVKIPQLAVRDNTGDEIPGYFNIWQWILQPGRLTSAERGGKNAGPKPEAILKWAHTPIAMLGGLWEETWHHWRTEALDPRPPVFILVCKNTALANVLYDWLAQGKAPLGIPPANLTGFLNTPEQTNTIVVHSRVVQETDTGSSRSDEARWMRFTLDTIGKRDWPRSAAGQPLFPEGFTELSEKLERPLHPPGRDIRCIVSVGMLTEGWDCNTVTHIIGLRPFQSQLLCEQVVGRGLRRASYALGENDKLSEEVAKVFGVPFQIVPFKANPTGVSTTPQKRYHVHTLPERAELEIRFPRVERYYQEIHRQITLDWNSVPTLSLEPGNIPAEVTMKGLHFTPSGRPSLYSPGVAEKVDLNPYRSDSRLQKLIFELSRDITRLYREQQSCEIPSHKLFPQIVLLLQRYLNEKVHAYPPADIKDVFLSPYYGWLVETILENLHGDVAAGETPELPLLENSRGFGSTSDIDFWTTRDVREVEKSHVNYVVSDTKSWEQSATYYLDTHPRVKSFVKNAGLGLGIPYFHNGQLHEYLPDFIVQITADNPTYLMIETKGYDPLKETKRAAAERWCRAVSTLHSFGTWSYYLAHKPEEVKSILSQ
jgi:type III restriction enzyme